MKEQDKMPVVGMSNWATSLAREILKVIAAKLVVQKDLQEKINIFLKDEGGLLKTQIWYDEEWASYMNGQGR